MSFVVTFLLWPVLVIICHSKWMKKIVKGNFWSECAKISFNVYIWHAVILAGYTMIPLKYSQFLYSLKGMIFTLILLVWIVGGVSHYFIEKPLNKFVMKKVECNFSK